MTSTALVTWPIDRIETWRSIPGMEGWYDASDKGRIRSLDRWLTDVAGKRQFFPGRLLATPCRGKYLQVKLWRAGKVVPVPVHVIVLRTFAGMPGPGEEARHGPRGAFLNWWPENLCWGTRLENHADQVRDGTRIRGNRHHQAILTDAIVTECRRRRRASGTSYRALAIEFGVSDEAIRNAVIGKTWTHVKETPYG